jgi:hypothetical protein
MHYGYGQFTTVPAASFNLLVEGTRAMPGETEENGTVRAI